MRSLTESITFLPFSSYLHLESLPDELDDEPQLSQEALVVHLPVDLPLPIHLELETFLRSVS